MFFMVIIADLLVISRVTAHTPKLNSETRYQEQLLGDRIHSNCTITCDIIKFNYDIIEAMSCGVNCNMDEGCEFFQSKSHEKECYLCTRDAASHEEVTRISMEAYTEENRNSSIYHALDRFQGKSFRILPLLHMVTFFFDFTGFCKTAESPYYLLFKVTPNDTKVP